MNPENAKTACLEFEGSLEDYMTGELEAPEAERLVSHLESCEGCREAFEAARFGATLLNARRKSLPGPHPSFAARVMAAIRSEDDFRARAFAFWRPLEMLAWRLSFVAALVLAFLVGYGLRDRSSSPPPDQAARSSEVREIFPDPVQQPASNDEVLMSIAEKNHGK